MKNALIQHAPANPTEISVEHGVEQHKTKKSRRQPSTICKGQRMRLKPTMDQAHLLRQWIGCGRYVWNWALAQQNTHYEQYISDKQLGQDMTGRKSTLGEKEISQQLTALRKTQECAFLKDCPSTVLTRALRHLGTSWSAYFDGLSGKRLDEPGKPKFRKKYGENESACFQIDARLKCALNPDNQTLRIPGLGPVEVVCSESLTGEISQITVRCKGDEWFVSLSLINVSAENAQRLNQAVENNKPSKIVVFPDNPTDTVLNPHRKGLASLDLSVVSGAVATTDGETTQALFNEHVLRSDAKKEKRRERLQRAYSRKQETHYNSNGIFRDKNGAWPKNVAQLLADKEKVKNTKRMENIKHNIAVCNIHEVFRKHDAIHKFTTALVQQNHTIVVETLMLHAMVQALSRGFRRRMHEACMGEIIRQLKYKCEWHNRSLIFVDKWFPSSKRCSNTACHEKNKHLLLKDRVWLCTSCNTKHVRDDNASFNLWQEGWRLLEEFFQKNNSNCLAAGSVVRGTQGEIFKSLPVVKTKVKKNIKNNVKTNLSV